MITKNIETIVKSWGDKIKYGPAIVLGTGGVASAVKGLYEVASNGNHEGVYYLIATPFILGAAAAYTSTRHPSYQPKDQYNNHNMVELGK